MDILENNLCPVVLFVYNRPFHTEQTLQALKENEYAKDSLLYIFADGPKENATSVQIEKIKETRRIIRKESWCKEVIITESEKNKGLANSVITGVTQVINKHGKVIVLEDDLITSKFFLRFLNESLISYESDKKIFSVGGYNYKFPIPKHYIQDVYIVHRTETWGWGTWKDRWDTADWRIKDFKTLFSNKREIKKFNYGGNDLIRLLKLQVEGKIDSWAIIWDYNHYIHSAYCLRPVISLVRNIGFDGSGIHCDESDIDLNSSLIYEKPVYDIELIENISADRRLEDNFRAVFSHSENFLTRYINKAKSYIKRIFKKIKS